MQIERYLQFCLVSLIGLLLDLAWFPRVSCVSLYQCQLCYVSGGRGYLVPTSPLMHIMTLSLCGITSYFKKAQTHWAHKRFTEELFLRHIMICKYLRIKGKSKKNGTEYNKSTQLAA